MNVTRHDIQLEAVDALTEVDALCLFFPEDVRPLDGLAGYIDWRMCGALSRLLMTDFFSGAAGDTVLMPSDDRIPRSESSGWGWVLLKTSRAKR